MDELTPEEKAILQSFRQLDTAKKELVVLSQNAFISWLQITIAWVWNAISSYVMPMLESIKGIFGLK